MSTENSDISDNRVDPITLEVVRGSLVATVLQMRATLVRTAYAPILYETRDFSCGLLTPDGELGAMSEDFSGHVFAMTLGLKETLRKFTNQIKPGDVLAVNDPYTGGTHMNDIAFYTPFFKNDEIILFIAVRAHFADVGGATPGSFSGQDTEIYQEGMRIVPVKIIEEGELNRGLWDVLFANMRLPLEREGDALAMLDTAYVAHSSIQELCHKYGSEIVSNSVQALLDSAEDVMRQRISHLPDGDYFYEHYMDNDGISSQPLPIKAKMTICRDSMTLDFTGTAPQVTGPMNCGIPVTQGGAFVVVKAWLDPKTPVNGGTFRPLDFIIPDGSCLAAQLPAPVGGCWEVYRQLQSTMVGLISQVIPNQPGGETIGSANHTYIGGYDRLRGKHYILYEYPKGGTPATIDTDGATGIQGYDAGDIPSVYPAESAEQRQPLLIESLSARIDGESAGFRRSGFGVVRRVKILADDSQLSVMTDRAIIPPWGAGGASPGSPNSYTVLRDGVEIQPSDLPGKIKGFVLKTGDVVLTKATSGGGVGDPLDREVDRVYKDVFEGYVTQQKARDVYGVVIKQGEVNANETVELRRELKDRRVRLEVATRELDEFDGTGLRICLLNNEDVVKIGVVNGDMVEYVGNNPAPLRAWVEIDDGIRMGSVPLGPIARNILDVRAGQTMWIRKLIAKTFVAN